MIIQYDYFTADGSRIPDRTARSIEDYLVSGIPPGQWLKAVLQNNLAKAVLYADEENRRNLTAVVSYLVEHAPAVAWGSPQQVEDWLKTFKTPEETSQ